MAVITALAGLALATGAATARPFVDAAGRTVQVPDRATRILAAGPPASVLLYTLAPEAMIGWVRAPSPDEAAFLTPETRGLPAYGRLTGRGNTANVEAVLTLKPDLIIDVGSTAPTYVSLADRVQAQTGIPYILLDGSLDRTAETYAKLGELVGARERATELAADAEATIAEVRGRIASIPADRRPRVYYARGPRGLETGVAGSINTEILELAGARNVAEGGGATGLTTISPEQVLAWDPDVIVTLDPAFRQAIAGDPLWSTLRAVRAGRVYQTPRLPFGWFDSPPGINRLIGLRWLAGLLHPGLFPEPMEGVTRDFYRRFYHLDLDAAQLRTLMKDSEATRP
ncbi:iron ABC transporter substrate-binding protein [Methylobacterium sp. 77]|uniref:iron ABC transporter substrate-binding protein n=1 Tax=Methylobacterium sp. 77 TaxID=1101192 RepID=UPI0003A304B3|nr:iron ABC transporter substrate-binding protein [Methylobacterium sp. 77]